MIAAPVVNVDTHRYWKLVMKTLDQVFHAGKDAKQRAQDLAEEISQTSLGEQESFYHVEPLTIASDIAGRTPTDAELLEYQRLQRTTV